MLWHRRMILLSTDFCIKVIILLIEGLIWFLNANELELLIRRSALGKGNNDAKA